MLLRRINFYGLGTALAIIALWQAAVAGDLITATYIVAPTEIVSAFADELASGQMQSNAVHTLSAVLIGWGIAMVLGVGLGSLLGLFVFMRNYSLASVDMLRSLPTVALVPPAVLVFGFSLSMEVAAVTYASIWPITINTMGGILRVPRELNDVARAFRLSRFRTAASVIVPAATPSILVGARLGLSTAVILAVIAEMVGNPTGLGYAMIFSQNALQPAAMFAYIVAIGLMGLLLNAALLALTRFLPPVAATLKRQERS